MVTSGRRRPDSGQARSDRHDRQRRQHVLDAAIAVVEEGEPGAELHVRQVAERAGRNRTVVHRHFADRSGLDRAVQAETLDGLWAELLPGIGLDPEQRVEALVAAVRAEVAP